MWEKVPWNFCGASISETAVIYNLFLRHGNQFNTNITSIIGKKVRRESHSSTILGKIQFLTFQLHLYFMLSPWKHPRNYRSLWPVFIISPDYLHITNIPRVLSQKRLSLFFLNTALKKSWAALYMKSPTMPGIQRKCQLVRFVSTKQPRRGLGWYVRRAAHNAMGAKAWE